MIDFDMDLDFAADRYRWSGGPITLADVCVARREGVAAAPDRAGRFHLFPANAPRRTDMGLWIETSRWTSTPSAARRNLRRWAATDVAVALDQVGLEGEANTASSVVALADGGTLFLTLDSGPERSIASVFARRLAGEGPLELTQDGGASWTRCDPGAAFAQFATPGQVLSHHKLGLRIARAGDAFAIGHVQNENSVPRDFPTSPIVPGFDARPFDALMMDVTGRFAPIFRSRRLTVVVEFVATRAFAVGGNAIYLHDGSADNRFTVNYTHFNHQSGLTVVGDGVARGYDPLHEFVDSETEVQRFGFAADIDANKLVVSLRGDILSRNWAVPWPDPGRFTTMRWGANQRGTPLNGVLRRVRAVAAAVDGETLARLTADA